MNAGNQMLKFVHQGKIGLAIKMTKSPFLHAISIGSMVFRFSNKLYFGSRSNLF